MLPNPGLHRFHTVVDAVTEANEGRALAQPALTLRRAARNAALLAILDLVDVAAEQCRRGRRVFNVAQFRLLDIENGLGGPR